MLHNPLCVYSHYKIWLDFNAFSVCYSVQILFQITNRSLLQTLRLLIDAFLSFPDFSYRSNDSAAASYLNSEISNLINSIWIELYNSMHCLVCTNLCNSGSYIVAYVYGHACQAMNPIHFPFHADTNKCEHAHRLCFHLGYRKFHAIWIFDYFRMRLARIWWNV